MDSKIIETFFITFLFLLKKKVSSNEDTRIM